MALGTPTIFRGNMNTVDQSITGGTALTGMVIRQFVDFQKYLDPTETPFTSSVSDGKQINQKKVEWGTGYLVPNKTTLAANFTASGTSITVASGDGPKGMVSQEVLIGSEIMWITAISGDTYTVVPGASGTTSANHSSGDTVEFLPPAALENVDSPLAPIAKGTLEYNYPQLMDYAIQLSERDNATPDYEFEGGNKYNQYLEKRMKEAAILFEKLAIRGRRSAESGGVAGNAAARPSTMGGVLQFTSTVYDLGGAALTEFNLQTLIGDTWERVGDSNVPTKLYVGRFLRQALDSLWNAQRYADVTDTETNLTWRRVITSFGPIDFVLSRYIPAGTAILCNPKDIKKHQYGSTGGWREVKLPASGPYIKGRFTGDYSMSFPRDTCRAIITNASTTASDYINM